MRKERTMGKELKRIEKKKRRREKEEKGGGRDKPTEPELLNK